MILNLLIILLINTLLLLIGTLFIKRIYINNINQITFYTITSLIFDLCLVLLIFFYNYNEFLIFMGGGYYFIIMVGFIILFIILLFSIYWQESTRNWFLVKIKQNQSLNVYNNIKNNISNLLLKKMNKLNQSTISFEYYFITATIIFLFPVLIYIKNLIIFYVIFEVIGILILILISFQITNESIKAAILYFFFGFYSTLFLIWGFTLLYTNQYTLIYNNNVINHLLIINDQQKPLELYIGILLLVIAFLIKLGVFPYQTWVIEVYTRLSNINHLFFISFITLGYLFSFINLISIIYNSTNTKNIWLIITLILSISAIGSTLSGALLLYSQSNVKGFFASNSIITNGLLSLVILTLFEFKVFINTATLLWYLFLYLIFYHIANYILFNSWNALLLWNFIKPLHFIQQNKSIIKPKILNFKKLIIDYLNNLIITISFLINFNKEIYIKFNNFISFKSYSWNKNYIKFILLNLSILLIKQILNSIKLSYYSLIYIFSKFLLKFLNLYYLILNYLTTIFKSLNTTTLTNNNYINNNFLYTLPITVTQLYKDYYLYTFIWILFGFPPFILFIIKFYLVLNILASGLILPIWLLLIITNIFVTGALCRILTLTTVKFNYL